MPGRAVGGHLREHARYKHLLPAAGAEDHYGDDCAAKFVLQKGAAVDNGPDTIRQKGNIRFHVLRGFLAERRARELATSARDLLTLLWARRMVRCPVASSLRVSALPTFFFIAKQPV